MGLMRCKTLQFLLDYQDPLLGNPINQPN
jgi:hypothetical protein